MAKIYETKEDWERERLRESSHLIVREKLTSETYGWTAAILSVPLILWSLFAKSPTGEIGEIKSWKDLGFRRSFKEMWEGAKDFFKHGPTRGEIGGALLLFGLIEIILSRKGRKKAEKELQKLGPEQVMLPPEIDTKNCTPCTIKTLAHGPRTLLEQAARSSDSAVAER